MKLRKIISGGQTGADQAGIRAGVDLNVETGGWMPKGWLTAEGPRPDLEKFGLKEHTSPKYPPRTFANVKDADGTLIFGDPNSAGCILTIRACIKMHKPYHVVFWPPQGDAIGVRRLFRVWMQKIDPEVLNVAGNREQSNTGINEACHVFLVAAIMTLRAFDR